MQLIQYAVTSKKQRDKVKIKVVNDTYRVENIIFNYIHNSNDYTYIGITPKINENVTVGDDSLQFREYEIEINIPTSRNIIIIINDDENKRFLVDDVDEDYNAENPDEKILLVSFLLTFEYKTRDIKLRNIDPILKYYRKLFPVDNLEAWATIRGEVNYVGRLNRISFDTNLRKYRVYFDNKMIFVFDEYPFSTQSNIYIQGVEHITPVDMFWIIDSNYTDLMFVKRMLVKDYSFASGMFDSLEDLLIALNDNSENDDLRFNQRFDILQVEFVFEHLNRRIIIDFNQKNIPVENILREINSTFIEIMPIPYRETFIDSSLSLMKMSLYMLDKEDPDAENIIQLDESHFNIETNCRIHLDCEITTVNKVPYYNN